mmetsp:Transcript_80121/g.216917  ORF Transcript_80121/g.216917 Transcript_80121/m.216917 type:complete len:271 (-) Transcript_80121:2-814(-)
MHKPLPIEHELDCAPDSQGSLVTAVFSWQQRQARRRRHYLSSLAARHGDTSEVPTTTARGALLRLRQGLQLGSHESQHRRDRGSEQRCRRGRCKRHRGLNEAEVQGWPTSVLGVYQANSNRIASSQHRFVMHHCIVQDGTSAAQVLQDKLGELNLRPFGRLSLPEDLELLPRDGVARDLIGQQPLPELRVLGRAPDAQHAPAALADLRNIVSEAHIAWNARVRTLQAPSRETCAQQIVQGVPEMSGFRGRHGMRCLSARASRWHSNMALA